MFGLPSSRGASGTGSITINRPIETVFNFITLDFFVNYPKWSPEVKELELLSEPPLKLGSLVRQVRVDNGQRSETTFKITVYQINKKLAFEGVSDSYRCSYEFIENQSSSTQVNFTFEIPKLELYMLPFEKLVRIGIQEGAKRNVRNLKKLIELT